MRACRHPVTPSPHPVTPCAHTKTRPETLDRDLRPEETAKAENVTNVAGLWREEEPRANGSALPPAGGVTVNVDSERLPESPVSAPVCNSKVEGAGGDVGEPGKQRGPLRDPKFARSQIDVPATSNVAPRWKLSRQRARDGQIVLKTVHDEVHISALLLGAGFLPANKADDRKAIEKALEAYIAAGKPALFDV